MSAISIVVDAAKDHAKQVFLWLAERLVRFARKHPKWFTAILLVIAAIVLTDLGEQNYFPGAGLLRAVRGGELFCRPLVKGAFDADVLSLGREWDFQDREFLMWGTGEDSTTKPGGKQSLRIARLTDEPAIGVDRNVWRKEIGGEARYTEYPRIEYQLPESWHGETIRMNVALRWEQVSPISGAYPGTVAVTMKVEKDGSDRYIVLLSEAVAKHDWKKHNFLPVRIPKADKVIVRVGLHGVKGVLFVDDISFDKCN